jgi:hypothetical protein
MRRFVVYRRLSIDCNAAVMRKERRELWSVSLGILAAYFCRSHTRKPPSRVPTPLVYQSLFREAE